MQWEQVAGGLKWISSGKDFVVGVNVNDDIYYRAGISASNPKGTKWVRIGGKLAQIDTDANNVWGVNSAHQTYTLTVKPTPSRSGIV